MQIYHYFSSINKHRKINRYFLDNLICRYLMVNKYNEQVSLTAIKKYLDWEKVMRNKYTYESFNHYHPLNIFKYIGKDRQGRPMLLFRSYNFLPDNVSN
jgi:hypothetical protein